MSSRREHLLKAQVSVTNTQAEVEVFTPGSSCAEVAGYHYVLRCPDIEKT